MRTDANSTLAMDRSSLRPLSKPPDCSVPIGDGALSLLYVMSVDAQGRERKQRSSRRILLAAWQFLLIGACRRAPRGASVSNSLISRALVAALVALLMPLSLPRLATANTSQQGFFGA